MFIINEECGSFADILSTAFLFLAFLFLGFGQDGSANGFT